MCQTKRFDEAEQELLEMSNELRLSAEAYDHGRLKILMGREDCEGVLQITEKYPDSPQMLGASAIAHAIMGDAEDALTASNEAIQKDPGMAIYRARVLDILGRLEEAASWYERSLSTPDGRGAEGYLSSVFERLGDIPESEAMFRRYLAGEPFLKTADVQQLLSLEERLGHKADAERAQAILKRIAPSAPSPVST